MSRQQQSEAVLITTMVKLDRRIRKGGRFGASPSEVADGFRAGMVLFQILGYSLSGYNEDQALRGEGPVTVSGGL